MKLLRIAHDATADGVAYQPITVSSTLWLQTYVRPHGCTPKMELQKVGTPSPTVVWTGTNDERFQYTGTIKVEEVEAGDYHVRVGSADLDSGAYVDCQCLSAQTTLTDPTQLVPVDDGVDIDDATWLAAWTADGATLSVINE